MADKPSYEELEQRVKNLERSDLERKRAENALRKTESELRAILDATPETIVHIDRKGTVLSANRTACERLQTSKEDFIGHCIYAFFPPEVAENRRRKYDETFVSGKPVSFEDSRAGMVFEQNVYPVFNEEKRVVTLVVFARDITKHKRAEEALQNSEATFRKLFEFAPDGIYLIDLEGTFIDGNRAAQKIVGYKKEELIGSNFASLDLLSPEDLPKAIENLNENLNGRATGPDEYRLKRKDGTQVVIEIMTLPVTINNQKAILGIARDITERKRAEEALQISEEKYKDILESIDDGYYEVDIAGNYTHFNDSMARILGYPRDELMGMNNRDYMDEDNAKMIFQAFNKVYKTGISTKALDWQLIRKDGSECFVETVVSLIKDSGGKGIGFRGVARDVTERKKLEEQLRQAHKMESIGTLSGGIAHDFNNILYMIIGNAELALEDIPERDPVHVNLEEIKAASLRAAGIVKQLLNFSRKAEQEYRPIDAVMVIKEALKFLRSTIPSTIEIRQKIAIKEKIIMADPIQINQVLMNICTNASQAMKKAGGIVEVVVEDVTLDAQGVEGYSDLTAGDYIKITVSDTGPGIDPAIIDRIFDPYFTTKEVGKGSGMGLAVVHGIVKSHNGAITVDSQLGKGTIFNILFPVVTEKPVKKIPAAYEMPMGNESVLFVDDEEPIADMTQLMLGRLGYRVETRLNPIEALELFRSKPHEFDLVITDMTMPQMTGVKLSEELKHVRSDIPVIICTGHSSLIDDEKAKELGIAAYVMKPIAMKALAITIRDVLENRGPSEHAAQLSEI